MKENINEMRSLINKINQINESTINELNPTAIDDNGETNYGDIKNEGSPKFQRETWIYFDDRRQGIHYHITESDDDVTVFYFVNTKNKTLQFQMIDGEVSDELAEELKNDVRALFEEGELLTVDSGTYDLNDRVAETEVELTSFKELGYTMI